MSSAAHFPAFLIQACGRALAQMGWMLAALGLGMMITQPMMGALTNRFGIRRVAASGALLALLATTPLLVLAANGLHLPVRVPALLLRGMGMSGVGLPSRTAAYASVRRPQIADGDDLAQHRPAPHRQAPRRPYDDDDLRVSPRLEA